MWNGGELSRAQIAYESWGELNADRDNAILLFTGLSPFGARRVVSRRSAPGLVAKDDRAGPRHRHRPLFRRVREFARQLLRFDRAGVA